MIMGTSQKYFILVTMATILEIQVLPIFNIFLKELNFLRLIGLLHQNTS